MKEFKGDKKNRAIAMDRAMEATRLMHPKYYPQLFEALKKGEEGKTIFDNLCVEAEIPEEMRLALWKGFLAYTAASMSPCCPWAPC
jgi:hypothetical protein